MSPSVVEAGQQVAQDDVFRKNFHERQESGDGAKVGLDSATKLLEGWPGP